MDAKLLLLISTVIITAVAYPFQTEANASPDMSLASVEQSCDCPVYIRRLNLCPGYCAGKQACLPYCMLQKLITVDVVLYYRDETCISGADLRLSSLPQEA